MEEFAPWITLFVPPAATLCWPVTVLVFPPTVAELSLPILLPVPPRSTLLSTILDVTVWLDPAKIPTLVPSFLLSRPPTMTDLTPEEELTPIRLPSPPRMAELVESSLVNWSLGVDDAVPPSTTEFSPTAETVLPAANE